MPALRIFLSLILLCTVLLPTVAYAVPDNHPSQAYAYIVDSTGKARAVVYKKGIVSSPRQGGMEIGIVSSIQDRDKKAEALAKSIGGTVVYVDKKQQAAAAQKLNPKPDQTSAVKADQYYAVIVGKDGTAYGSLFPPAPGTHFCGVSIARQYFKPQTLQKMNDYFSKQGDCDKRAALIAQITSGKIIYADERKNKKAP